MSYFVILLLWLLTQPAYAGAPPPEEIPWDTVWVADTVYAADGPVVMEFAVEFITRDRYERDVLGWDNVANLREAQRDLEVIKKLIKAKKKKP